MNILKRMPMKKWFTSIYLVKKYKVNSPGFLGDFDQNSLTDLDHAGFSPSATSVRRILDFASSYEVLETESVGQMEMNKN
jgi:hypothetical protein